MRFKFSFGKLIPQVKCALPFSNLLLHFAFTDKCHPHQHYLAASQSRHLCRREFSQRKGAGWRQQGRHLRDSLHLSGGAELDLYRCAHFPEFVTLQGAKNKPHYVLVGS